MPIRPLESSHLTPNYWTAGPTYPTQLLVSLKSTCPTHLVYPNQLIRLILPTQPQITLLYKKKYFIWIPHLPNKRRLGVLVLLICISITRNKSKTSLHLMMILSTSYFKETPIYTFSELVYNSVTTINLTDGHSLSTGFNNSSNEPTLQNMAQVNSMEYYNQGHNSLEVNPTETIPYDNHLCSSLMISSNDRNWKILL